MPISTNLVLNFRCTLADKLVPLPSLFFIGKTGAPLEIVTYMTKTVDELESKIDSVLVKVNTDASATQVNNALASQVTPSASQANPPASLANASTSVDQSADDTETVCENGVCFKRPKQSKSTESESNATETLAGTSTDSVDSNNEEKLLRARELIAKKRKEKEDEDAQVIWLRMIN